MKQRKQEQGFTLIELIMVIVIMGILSAVVVPKFFDLESKTHEKTKQAVISNIKVGLNLHAMDHLLTSGKRTFPEGGTLSLDALLDEVPDNWSISNGVGDDTIKYNGDASEWVYDTGLNEESYTITEQ